MKVATILSVAFVAVSTLALPTEKYERSYDILGRELVNEIEERGRSPPPGTHTHNIPKGIRKRDLELDERDLRRGTHIPKGIRKRDLELEERSRFPPSGAHIPKGIRKRDLEMDERGLHWRSYRDKET